MMVLDESVRAAVAQNGMHREVTPLRGDLVIVTP
jgi:hypothetical protein